jgi:hypothetical protein
VKAAIEVLRRRRAGAEAKASAAAEPAPPPLRFNRHDGAEHGCEKEGSEEPGRPAFHSGECTIRRIPRDVFVTGSTGYIGRRLIEALVARGHRVRALVRAESAGRAPVGATAIIGNALDASTFASGVTAADTIVHLVGTPHPSPSKAAEFQRVDLPSIGPRTVDGVASAGLGGIAVVAGSAVVVEPERIALAADRAGVFVVGVRDETPRQ